MRRPKQWGDGLAAACPEFYDAEGWDISPAIVMEYMELTGPEARRLAAWLLKAADWIKQEPPTPRASGKRK